MKRTGTSTTSWPGTRAGHVASLDWLYGPVQKQLVQVRSVDRDHSGACSLRLGGLIQGFHLRASSDSHGHVSAGPPAIPDGEISPVRF